MSKAANDKLHVDLFLNLGIQEESHSMSQLLLGIRVVGRTPGGPCSSKSLMECFRCSPNGTKLAILLVNLFPLSLSREGAAPGLIEFACLFS